MEKVHIGIIGLMAGSMTTFAFVPQIVKILRTKHARDISLYMYVISTAGIFLWLVYGLLIGEMPVILANAIGFVLCSFILTAKLKYARRDKQG